jgi:hypothetical protein
MDQHILQLERVHAATTATANARREFQKARVSANLKGWFDRIFKRDNHLLDPKEVEQASPAPAGDDARTQIVPIRMIVGSVGRNRDFNRSFQPLKAHNVERWTSIDKAYHRGESLPPVELYRVGDRYFVIDGHHRISVARLHGQEFIDANVRRMMK